MSWMDEAMEKLQPWIGRVRIVEDDIGLMAVRRAAGAFDMDPESFKRGTELPPHWFGIFFAETVRHLRQERCWRSTVTGATCFPTTWC